MSSTTIYSHQFVVPVRFADTPMPFEKFAIKDEDGIITGQYSYNEACTAGVIDPYPTPAIHADEASHFAVQSNITDPLTFGLEFTAYVASIDTEIGIEYYDEDTDFTEITDADTIWITSGDSAQEYDWMRFMSESPIFVAPVAEEEE